MTALAVTNAFPKLSGLAGVRRVKDATVQFGRPAIEVIFEDGLAITVARDEISREHFCIWFPPTEADRGIASVAAKLSQAVVMNKLSDLAAVAAKSN